MLEFEKKRTDNIESIIAQFDSFKKEYAKKNNNIMFFCDGFKNEIKVFVSITYFNIYPEYTEQLTYARTYSCPFDDVEQSNRIVKDILMDTQIYLIRKEQF